MLNESREGGGESSYEIDDDSYHMVTQLHWEDDVIWNGEEYKRKVTAIKLNKYFFQSIIY